jgi:hypothetical protein
VCIIVSRGVHKKLSLVMKLMLFVAIDINELIFFVSDVAAHIDVDFVAVTAALTTLL